MGKDHRKKCRKSRMKNQERSSVPPYRVPSSVDVSDEKKDEVPVQKNFDISFSDVQGPSSVDISDERKDEVAVQKSFDISFSDMQGPSSVDISDERKDEVAVQKSFDISFSDMQGPSSVDISDERKDEVTVQKSFDSSLSDVQGPSSVDISDESKDEVTVQKSFDSSLSDVQGPSSVDISDERKDEVPVQKSFDSSLSNVQGPSTVDVPEERKDEVPVQKSFHMSLSGVQVPSSDERSDEFWNFGTLDDEKSLDISLSDIQFSFENPPKSDPWNETFKRRVQGKDIFYHPRYHEYPKIALPYEYHQPDRSKLLKDRKGPEFRHDRNRFVDDGKVRSPRGHSSTDPINYDNVRRRPTRKCSKNPNINYKDTSNSTSPETSESSLGSPSSLTGVKRRPFRKCKTNPNICYKDKSSSTSPETIESSTDSEHQSVSSIDDDSDILPVDPQDDIYAAALERLASGETSNLEVQPGPCLPVSQMLLEDPLPDLGIDLTPGPSIPFESILSLDYNFYE